jgi:hypothetical protein
MALSEADRVRMLEEMATDMTLKATQRLRAFEELGRIESRRTGAAAAPEPDEVAPDPMADLDEMERARQKRGRRRAA